VRFAQPLKKPPRTLYGGLHGACEECRRNLETFSKLAVCQLCGRLGGERHIYYRGGCHSWNMLSPTDFSYPAMHCLCGSCWNRVQVIVRRQDEIEQMRDLIRRVERALADKRKENARGATPSSQGTEEPSRVDG
jgi:hypothetical protein